MFTWLTEDPTNAYFVLGAIAIVLIFTCFVTGRALYLFIAVGVGILVGGVALVDTLVVTDREQVEANTLAMGQAVEDADMHAFLSHISKDYFHDGVDYDWFRRAVEPYLDDPPHQVVLWNLVVKPAADRSSFLCSCSARSEGLDDVPDGFPVRLEFTFKKDPDGHWRVHQFEPWDVMRQHKYADWPRYARHR